MLPSSQYSCTFSYSYSNRIHLPYIPLSILISLKITFFPIVYRDASAVNDLGHYALRKIHKGACIFSNRTSFSAGVVELQTQPVAAHRAFIVVHVPIETFRISLFCSAYIRTVAVIVRPHFTYSGQLSRLAATAHKHVTSRTDWQTFA